MIAYQSGDTFHLATAEGLLAYGVSRAKAVATLSRVGLDRAAIDDILAGPVDGPTWIATLRSAVAGDTLAASAAIGAIEDSAEAQRLSAQLALVLEAVESMNAELATANQLAAEAAAREAAAEAASERRRQQMEAAKAEAAKREETKRTEAARIEALNREAARWADTRVVEYDTGEVYLLRDTYAPGGKRVAEVVQKWAGRDRVPSEILARLK